MLYAMQRDGQSPAQRKAGKELRAKFGKVKLLDAASVRTNRQDTGSAHDQRLALKRGI
jgi:hypothetical protein